VMAYQAKVVLNIHNNGSFEFGLLRNVGNGKQKSVEKEKQKVSEGEAELRKKKRLWYRITRGLWKREKKSWLKMLWMLKKPVLPRLTGIVIKDGGSMNVKAVVGSMNVGARSKRLLNARARVSDVDNVGVKRAVKSRFIILGL
ncbi:hypothetical protein Tco_1564252, partial [Tanacetum coccineum]